MTSPQPHSQVSTIDRRLSIAPMLDWTDRHCRYFLRLISKHVLLYTEMVTTGAILHGDLGFRIDLNVEVQVVDNPPVVKIKIRAVLFIVKKVQSIQNDPLCGFWPDSSPRPPATDSGI